MRGKLISFIGMDGAGKTTLSKLALEALKRDFKAELVYTGRGRHNILPIQIFGKAYKRFGGEGSNRPINGKKFNKISLIHTLAAPVFAFDLLLRYLFVIYPKLLKNDYVITDRYSTDILLMNKVPVKLKKFLYLFLPKADKTIYIYNTLDVLHKRKPEHPVEDLRRQEKIFSRILGLVHAYKIKNDSIKISLNKILKIIQNGN